MKTRMKLHELACSPSGIRFGGGQHEGDVAHAVSDVAGVRSRARRGFLALSGALMIAPAVAMSSELSEIHVLVGFPPGGAADAVARHVGEGLRDRIAPIVVVENRSGASGRIAVEALKNAKPDGAVLLSTPSFPLVISPHVYREEIRYDTLRDFVPVGIAARSMLCLSVGPAVPETVKTVADFVRWVKDDPKRRFFGAPPGGSQHFAGQIFSNSAKLGLSNVPYKGGAPAMIDLLAGLIPANVSPVAEALPYHESGKIRILAVTATRRSPSLPEIPTFTELGYTDVVFQDWIGVFAPAGTPMSLVEQINGAMAQVSHSPEGVATLARFGMVPDTPDAEQFRRIVEADYERYGMIVRELGFRPQE